jgi:hypothetical protein
MDETNVRDFMSNESHDKAEWDANRKIVKRLNGGSLPDFWKTEVFQDFARGVRDSWDTQFRGEPGEEF